MDVRLTWTDCDVAGDYVVPNVLSPRDLVSRPYTTYIYSLKSALGGDKLVFANVEVESPLSI